MFEGLQFPLTTRVYLATYILEGRAVIWWEIFRNRFRAKSAGRRDPEAEMTWNKFTQLFMEQYIGDVVQDLCQTQSDNLKQNNISVVEYENDLIVWLDMCPNTMVWRSKRREGSCEGLRPEI